MNIIELAKEAGACFSLGMNEAIFSVEQMTKFAIAFAACVIAVAIFFK
jgi:hypothetical protein